MTENSKPMIFARIKTHRSWEDEDLFEVLFTAETLPMLTVTVCATDESIAAVEALLHLRKERDMRPYQVKLVRCVTAGADDPDWVTVFSSACNYLLTHHLREENMILVACFLSLCNWNMPGDDLAAIEKELLRQELRCNCVEKTLYHYDYTEAGGAKLTPKQILFRCGHIWTSYLFAESLGHYVKRCVAVAGDTLTIKDGQVYVNSQPQENWPGVQNSYRVVTDGKRINQKNLEKLGINIRELWFHPELPGYPEMPLTAEMLEKVQSYANVVSVTRNVDAYPPDYPDSDATIFPFSPDYQWTRDNFGPLWIPAKGVEVELTVENLPLYQRIITSYEGNELEVKDGRIFINSEEVHSYTFQQDYYFMMGDNRHNSLDSRYWGFVPEDHIVGKPAVVWLSIDGNRKFPNNIRWRRFFKFV